MSWLRRRTPEDRFSDEIAGLARSLLGATVRALPDFALELDLGRPSPVVMQLHNVYRETADLSGRARADRLRTAVLAMVPQERPQRWDEAADRLMPAVRAASWAAAAGPHDVLRRSLVPFVSTLCALDSEHAMTFAVADDLARWGATTQEAYDRAALNLAAQPLPLGTTDGGAYVLGPDGYVSSWLALPEVLEKVAGHLDGTIVAVAPSRDVLVLVDVGAHATAVTLLAEALGEYESAARQLSPVPYSVTGGVLRPWQPPAGHPAAPLVVRAGKVLAAVEYRHQRTRLEELFARAGEDVYVAACTLMTGDGDHLWSWTSWVRQVTDGLLPQSDYVVLGDHDAADAQVVVPWADAVRLAGPALEDAGYDPPLWRHHGWPDGATTAALRAAAVEVPGTGPDGAGAA